VGKRKGKGKERNERLDSCCHRRSVGGWDYRYLGFSFLPVGPNVAMVADAYLLWLCMSWLIRLSMGYYQPLGCPGSLGRKSAAHHTTPTTLAFKNHRDGFLEKRALQYTATAEL